MQTGLVLGKFLPLHKGHLSLIHFAQQQVDKLFIVVESVQNEPILHATRLSWFSGLAQNAVVIPLTTHMPQHPDDIDEFWFLWKYTLQQVLPQKIDFVFASESYGSRLAAVLGARFIPFDCGRFGQSVSATDIRSDLYGHWFHLPLQVQMHFQKRICILGAESTGKSTLAADLAQYFNGQLVPEYARNYLEALKRDPLKDDMLLIAKGQSSSEHVLAHFGAPFLFCDTDPLTTALWSQWFFEDVDDAIWALVNQHSYDLILVLEPDVEWVDDPIRYTPNSRDKFHQSILQALSERNQSHLSIGGDWSLRWEQSTAAITALIQQQLSQLHWDCP